MFRKKIIGLDINETYIKAVLMSKTGNKLKLLAVNKVNFPDSTIFNGQIKNKEKFIECVKELLATSNPISIKPGDVICSIPGTEVFIHTFSFPHKFTDNEILASLPNETEKIIPFSYSQTYSDFQKIKDDAHVSRIKKDIIYAAVPKEVADEYLEALEACELIPKSFCIKENSLIRSLIPFLEKDQAILIIDFGTDLIRFIIYDHGGLQAIEQTLISKRDFDNKIGSALGVNADKVQELINMKQVKEEVLKSALEPLLQKIIVSGQKIISQYQNISVRPIEKVILAGELLETPGVIIYMINHLTQKVEIGNPWTEVMIMTNYFTRFSNGDEVGKTKAVVFASAIGSAKSGLDTTSDREINIIPERITARQEKRKKGLFLNSLAVFLIFICCLNFMGFLYTFGKLYFEKRSVTKANKVIENITSGTRYQEIKTDILNFNQEVDILYKIQRDTFSVPQILSEIKNYIPKNITLTSLTFNDSEVSVDISGIAPRREDILIIQDNLKQLNFAEKIYSPLSNLDQQKNISFVINIKLNIPKVPRFGSKD